MEPKDFFRVLLRRKRTVATAIFIVLATSLFGSMRKDPTYGAECRVLVAGVGTDISSEESKSVELYATLPTLKSVLESPMMAQRVADALKRPVGQVYGRVNATLVPGTTIYLLRTVDKSTVANSQQYVATLCNTYAEQFVTMRKDQGRQILNDLKDNLENEVDNLFREAAEYEKQMITASQRGQNPLPYEVKQSTALFQMSERQQRISKLETQLGLVNRGDAGGQVLIPAGITGTKIGPNVKRDALVGLIVGLIFGIALAFIREYLDDTLRDKESIQRDLAVPVLANMPPESGRSPDGFVDPSSKAVDAARTLRTNLYSLGFPHDAQALVVTSTLAKRRSTTLVNLAAAVAEAGRTVLVIGADFRNPRLHEQFGVGNAIGLTSVIRGQMSLDQAVRPVPGLDGVYLLPSGPQVTNPGELLSSDGMEDLIHDARDWADAVIIDAPPVLTAADASVLGTLADGVVLVMSTGQTQRQQAVEAKDQLVAAGANVLGVVLSGVTEQPGGKVLSLSSFRRDEDDDDLPPLMPYGAWAGGDWGGPTLFDSPAAAPSRPAARTRGGSGRTVARNGRKTVGRNGNGKTVGRNGNGATRTGNGGNGGARTGNGAARTGNGGARTGNGGARTGNGKTNGGERGTTARRGGSAGRNGGTYRNGGDGGSTYRNGGNGGSTYRNGGSTYRNGGNGGARRAVNGERTGNGGSPKVVAARRPRRAR